MKTLPEEFKQQVLLSQKRNFAAFAVHSVLFTLGWLFKTESIIISAAARQLGASNALIGLFPMFSRLGNSIPPLFVANRVEHLPRKKPVLVVLYAWFFISWILVGLSFLFMPDSRHGLLLFMFTVLYVSFHADCGACGVLSDIVSGKVIQHNTRGRLLGISGIVGGMGALLLTFCVVRPILGMESGPPLLPFAWLFLLAGAMFFLAWTALFGIQEPSLAGPNARPRSLKRFALRALVILRRDRDFRTFFYASCFFMGGFSLIPFYTVYAKTHLNVANSMLAYFLASQMGAQSIAAYVLGRIADRFGNRKALRISGALQALTPVVAVLVGTLPGISHREWLFCGVYALVGFVVPANRLLVNYLLEAFPVEKHGRYLSIYSLLLSLMFFVPLSAGFLMDRFYYTKVFLVCSGIIGVGVWYSSRLYEPRGAQRT